ncbi:MAG: DNA-processing protein DprA [Rhodobacteraceae bacterium]|nr:DNA-processing protein DprA [Paracoccaceae bacterium]
MSRLRLIRSRRIGVATFYRLLAEHGSARAALDALPDIARAAGVEKYAPCPEPVALAELRAGKAVAARLLCWDEPDYPAALRHIADAPPLLWAMGDLTLAQRPMVALVGARNASSLGTRMARKLAEGLSAAGLTVVSGLARGIDAAAHLAALPQGTVAVMAGGVDVVYPVENTALADAIGKKGLRLSEQPCGLEPQARHFPLRNRIISGLARCVVVVEAAARSGSLITARCALDQGRDVMAVPGSPFDGRASGCNMLIRDGATLVRSAEDVLELLKLPTAGPDQTGTVPTAVTDPPGGAVELADPTSAPSRPEAAALHRRILGQLGPSPLAEDQLIRDLAIAPAAIAPELLALELEGQILRHPGGLLSRAV